jgi:hypothetical protein
MGHMPYYIQMNKLVIVCGIGLCLKCCYVKHFFIRVIIRKHPNCFIYQSFTTIFLHIFNPIKTYLERQVWSLYSIIRKGSWKVSPLIIGRFAKLFVLKIWIIKGFFVIKPRVDESFFIISTLLTLSVKSFVGLELHPSLDVSSPFNCCLQSHEMLLNKGMNIETQD